MEHEVHFLKVIQNEKWLPVFERIFCWGKQASLNNVDPNSLRPVETPIGIASAPGNKDRFRRVMGKSDVGKSVALPDKKNAMLLQAWRL